MAGIEFTDYDRNLLPAWVGDYLSREHLLPAGGMVDPSEFTPDSDGRVYIPSGTLVGRTLVERDAGTGYGPYAEGDDDVYLIVHDVRDANRDPEVTLYRHGSVVKVNFLPEGVDAAAVEQRYATQIGVQ